MPFTDQDHSLKRRIRLLCTYPLRISYVFSLGHTIGDASRSSLHRYTLLSPGGDQLENPCPIKDRLQPPMNQNKPQNDTRAPKIIVSTSHFVIKSLFIGETNRIRRLWCVALAHVSTVLKTNCTCDCSRPIGMHRSRPSRPFGSCNVGCLSIDFDFSARN